MKKAVFLGSKKIGLECLKILNEAKGAIGVEIAGVLTNERGKDVAGYARSHGLPLLATLDDYLAIPHVDLAISVQYHAILKERHIAKARELAVNLHMAPLPEYRGCNQFSFAIAEGRNEFGVTLHQIDTGIDSGDIIAELRFPIPAGCWVSDLYQLAFDKSVELFRRELPSLAAGTYTLTPQAAMVAQRGTSLHFRKEIEDLKRIDLSWPAEKIISSIRATYMPGFQPPYFEIDGEKVFFVHQSEMNR